MYSEPIAYFITFTTRGTWLHGKENGSIDRDGKWIKPNPEWERYDMEEMGCLPIHLSQEQQGIVKTAIAYYCHQQGWFLHALEVLSNHVHLVVTAKEESPEKVSAKIKAASSKMLHKRGNLAPNVKPWTRNASERYVFNKEELTAVIHYVNHQR